MSRRGSAHGHWKTTTLVAGLRLGGLMAPMIVDGAMNGDAFTAYAESFLAPTLAPGDVVIMDNLPAHKVSGAPGGDRARRRQLGGFNRSSQQGLSEPTEGSRRGPRPASSSRASFAAGR